jgi:hypothetical protein
MRNELRRLIAPACGVLVLYGSACVEDPGASDELGTLPPKGIVGGGGGSAGSAVTAAGTVAGGSRPVAVDVPSAGAGGIVSGGAPAGGAGATAIAGAGAGIGGSSVAGAASGDPLASGGPSKCPLAGSMLCDGFETAAPGEAGSVFKLELGNGSTGVVDSSKAFRGAKSVHLKTATAQAFITETASFTGTTAAANNALWGRIFIWFEVTGDAPKSHDVFIRLEDPASSSSSAQLHVAGGSRGQLAAEIRSGSDLYKPKIVEPPPAGTVLFPLATPKWQCWEWHTTADNTLEFYIDGELYAPMSVTAGDEWPFPIFKKLYLGFMQYGTTPATELWIDEVALSDTRVGCGN